VTPPLSGEVDLFLDSLGIDDLDIEVMPAGNAALSLRDSQDADMDEFLKSLGA